MRMVQSDPGMVDSCGFLSIRRVGPKLNMSNDRRIFRIIKMKIQFFISKYEMMGK